MYKLWHVYTDNAASEKKSILPWAGFETHYVLHAGQVFYQLSYQSSSAELMTFAFNNYMYVSPCLSALGLCLLCCECSNYATLRTRTAGWGSRAGAGSGPGGTRREKMSPQEWYAMFTR